MSPLKYPESRRLLLCSQDPAELRDFQVSSSGDLSPHPSSVTSKSTAFLFRPCLKFAANFCYARSGVWLLLVPGINAHCIALK